MTSLTEKRKRYSRKDAKLEAARAARKMQREAQLALGIVAVFTTGGSYLLYRFTHAIIPLRVSHAEEEMALDLSQHGESLDYAESTPQVHSNVKLVANL